MVRTALLATTAFALGACTTTDNDLERAAAAATEVVEEALQEVTAEAQSVAMAEFFDTHDKAELALYPMSKSYRGIIDEDYYRLGDFTDKTTEASRALQRAAAREMQERFDYATLNAQDQLSYRLFLINLEETEKMIPYDDHGYLFNQMSGLHTGLPAFMINIHRVSEPAHAEAYIARIADLSPVLRDVTKESADRAAKGIMPPDWVYPRVIEGIDNILDAGLDNAVLEDFRTKVGGLAISDAAKADLIARAEATWDASARPAYVALKTEMLRQQAIAPTDDGVWRLPDGAGYYQTLLSGYTNSDMTPDEVHQIGLDNVERIHGLMRGIMAEVGFEGTLADFFEFTRSDPQFFAKSREEYLAKVDAVYAQMNPKLPEYFGILPKDELVVKPVEAFREKSAGKAFYQSPAPDGSRPGTYYVNLYDLNSMSLNELEALAYHEGNPGHHLQRSIQTGLDGLPAFRRFGGWTAYTEGWGLYSEELGKDMGFYEDPYSDFGRLGMELWRAARLVVDTGLHHKRWTREEAIEYLMINTPNPEGDAVKAIERYAVYPGQATAYMIGKLKIMELREWAMSELGDDFSYADFHDLVLAAGPRPLQMLEEDVKAWVAAEKG